jgi:glycosyltransferase involved in cell wall biosynthesis
VIVSNDRPGVLACRKAAETWGAQYVESSTPGLCVNRNNAVSHATGQFIMLLDDDAILHPAALAALRGAVSVESPLQILTGAVDERDHIAGRSEASYLGFFRPAVRPVMINLNANLFPRSAFELARFDEAIEYGYEDMDLLFNLASRGYRVRFVEGFANTHWPPPAPSRPIAPVRRARFYVGIRRRLTWQRRPLGAAAFIGVATAHGLLAAVRAGTAPHDVVRDMRWALRMALRKRRDAGSGALLHHGASLVDSI